MSDTVMDQVIDAIAQNPLSHVIDEDTDAVVMPDFFEGPLRWLLLRQDDGTPRIYLKALCVSGAINFAGNMLIAGHALAVSRPAFSGCACWVDEREPESSDLAVLSAMGLVPRGLNGLLMPYMGLQLAWSLHPTDGALAELGMGSAKVSQRVVASLTKWKY